MQNHPIIDATKIVSISDPDSLLLLTTTRDFLNPLYLQSPALLGCISPMTQFSCMFDQCELEFQTLHQFKMHITEDHQKPEEKSADARKENAEAKQDSDADDERATNSKAKERNAKHLAMDAAEKSALNGLLKLCELTKTDAEASIVASKPKVLTITEPTSDTINNIPAIPLLSPKNTIISPARKVQSPKNRKFPLQVAIMLGENESSAKFYEKGKPNAINLTTQNGSPRGLISNITMRSLAASKHAQNRVSGKKRKISEMNSDQLAHLCLKLQDKIKTLDVQQKLSQKQLAAVENLYRKKAKKQAK